MYLFNKYKYTQARFTVELYEYCDEFRFCCFTIFKKKMGLLKVRNGFYN